MPGSRAPLATPAWERWARRALDVVIAATALLVGSPLFAVLAVWIRLDGPGPVIFRQQRVGLGGVPFTLLKFRSLRSDGDDSAHRRLIEAELRGEDTTRDGTTKLDVDHRLTRSGRFLRRTSLDELPQLVNVLRGDMSLVGPRPAIPWEVEMFPPWAMTRATVRPGLTGLWQVSGRNRLTMTEGLELDVEYVKRATLLFDLQIMFRTIPALLRGGAR